MRAVSQPVALARAATMRMDGFRRRSPDLLRRAAGHGRHPSVSRQRAARPARAAGAHRGGRASLRAVRRRLADHRDHAAAGAGLQERLAAAGHPLPVYVGMRNWHPFLADTLREMSRAGVRRAIGFIMAAQAAIRAASSIARTSRDARAALRAAGLADVDVTYVARLARARRFHRGQRRARAAAARSSCRPPCAPGARLIFTAHSIPTARWRSGRGIASSSRDGAAAVARGRDDRLGAGVSEPQRPPAGSLARAGRRATTCARRRAEGAAAAVLCPIGFVCDHIEVLYDLDREAAAVAREMRACRSHGRRRSMTIRCFST